MSTATSSQTSRQLSVIIADDESSMRLLMERLLSKLGYRVAATASNGMEAVEMVRSHQPDFLILDIAMPLMNGLDAAQRILAEREIPIIVCSGAVTLENRERATQMGIQVILAKPFTVTHLKEALLRLGVQQEATCTLTA